jgi:hypothetical protein
MPLPKPEEAKLGHHLSFRVFLALFWLIGADLWQLEGDEVEDGMGKTWIQRGELRGFCGQFAGCYCSDAARTAFPACRDSINPFKGVNCCLPRLRSL